ncbi:MAG: 3-deoxy-D-manno-octulosonic acid transferase [Parabacteroides sp.]
MLYTAAIQLYALTVSAVAPFHKKARLMRAGQAQTTAILREKIDRKAKYIWFHASSLGEFEQGRPMIEQIRKVHPEYKILLTFFSPSGYEVRKNYAGADVVCYLPFDTPGRVEQFLDLANPAMAIFIKYEFWGNYLHTLQQRGIPVYIISAIFRREQLFFQWFGKPYRKMLDCFNHLFVQDERSKALLEEYGIRNVTVAGDTRFDRVIDVYHQAKQIPLVERFIKGTDGQQPPLVFVAGSSWPEDEAIFIPYFERHPEMKLIIAPHEIHEGHLKSIEARLHRPAIRLSQATEQNVADKDCLIVDSFGLLSSLYRYGQIAYIGGGFGAGIHNTLEAAVYGIPVLFGPRFQKFKEAKDLIAEGGAFTFDSEAAFEARMNKLLTSSDQLQQASRSAGQFVHSHGGATTTILKEIGL